MTHTPIRAVVFDMGGTLEDLYYDEAVRAQATRGLQELLRECGIDLRLSLPALQSTVIDGINAYQQWREQTEIELPPQRVWSEYVLAHHNLYADRLLVYAEELAFFYETHFFVRSLRPQVPALLAALRERGLHLAIISNVISRQLVPRKLLEYGIAGYFDPVVTSAEFGWRKPNKRIFAEAAQRLQLPPAACAYVGDTLSRDVSGAHHAGYGLSILIPSFLTDKVDRHAGSVKPDAKIQDLAEILALVSRSNK